ncbi:MAG: DUF4303 domain-containing protein [Nannocystaceae bacterium]|nr:DUF4303 domain-containing protein [Nannocystaceae bacterium]
MTELDFQTFTRLLMDNLEAAHSALSRRFPEHQLYTFGPYTNGAFEYLVPTASSDRGLAEAVATYKEGPSYAATPVETLAMQLKWSPCDSPLHEDVSFEDEVTAFMEHVSDGLRSAYEDEDHTACRELDESVHVAMCTALKTLDLRGVFGSGTSRPLLNVWKADQSDEERLSFAEILNPAPVVKRFQAELLEISRLG